MAYPKSGAAIDVKLKSCYKYHLSAVHHMFVQTWFSTKTFNDFTMVLCFGIRHLVIHHMEEFFWVDEKMKRKAELLMIHPAQVSMR